MKILSQFRKSRRNNIYPDSENTSQRKIGQIPKWHAGYKIGCTLDTKLDTFSFLSAGLNVHMIKAAQDEACMALTRQSCVDQNGAQWKEIYSRNFTGLIQ